MSPENDQNPQPSNLESAAPENAAEIVSSPSVKNSGAEVQAGTGVAAAVAVVVVTAPPLRFNVAAVPFELANVRL